MHFAHALIDKLVHRQLNVGRRDSLALAPGSTVVHQRADIRMEIALKFVKALEGEFEFRRSRRGPRQFRCGVREAGRTGGPAESSIVRAMICRDARHSIARFEGCAGSGSVFRHSLDRHSRSPSRCFSRAIEIGVSDETSPGDVQRARTATDRPLAAWRPRRRRGP